MKSTDKTLILEKEEEYYDEKSIIFNSRVSFFQ